MITNPLKILIVDDDPLNIVALEQELELIGYKTESTTNSREALKKILAETYNKGFPGILVTDIRMSQMDGLELMKRTLEIDHDLPVILVTAYGDIPTAVQAMRDGAYDYITRPITPEKLADVVKHAMEKRSLILENRSLRAEIKIKSGMEARIIGNSPSIAELRKIIANLADFDTSVLILGETGTGKELVARCLHEFSHRRENHFVPVNCGAIPEPIFESELFGHEAGAFTGANKPRKGKLEHAHSGTVFFDEIESMPLQLQVKLLRVLQDSVIERLGSNRQIYVNFRVVAATKADLLTEVKNGRFREDLYFRLNVAEIILPPLRDRREDIPLLFEFFATQIAARYEREVPTLSHNDLHELMAYSWPGNIRELKNVAERNVLGLRGRKESIAKFIHSPANIPLTFSEQVEAFEKCVIEQCLIDNKGNVKATRESLNMPRRTLNEKMRKYGLISKEYL